jgi:DNA repair protein RecO (recombination protein O)
LRIIDKCLAVNDPHPEIFNLLKNSLELLKGKDNLGILYIFLIKFLTLSGFKPELNRCLSCHEKVASKLFFSAKYGGLLCHRCHHKDRNVYPISRETSAAINYIQNNQFPQILRLNYTTKSEKEMIFILRRFLGYHLNFDPFTIINKLTPINC